MRLNTTSQDWAYSIERLSHKVSAGFSFKAAEGSLSNPAEGSSPKAAEGSSPKVAEGSSPKAAEGSLSSSSKGLWRCALGGCSLLAHVHKLKGLLKSGLVGWLVLIAQFSLPAYSEQTDDAAIHSQLDRLHQMASQADFDAYFALYSPDAVFIGTDAGERWTIDKFKAYAEPHFSAGRGWTYRTIERHIMGEGTVRWFDELLWNEKLGPCRGSGVIVKAENEWLVSHYVLSLAVPNQIAGEVGARAISIEKARRPKSPSNQ